MTKKFYHFTDPANLASIREHGLLPFANPNLEDDDRAAVWLTTKEGPSGYGEARLRVRPPNDKRLELADDDRDGTWGGVEWWIYYGAIPPDLIEFEQPADKLAREIEREAKRLKPKAKR
jgi:hypothetical protein